MSDHVLDLADLVVEIRDDIVPKVASTLEDDRTCRVCGAAEYAVEIGETDSRVEWFLVDCPSHRCDGDLSVTRITVGTTGEIPIHKERLVEVACTDCDGPERRAVRDRIYQADPVETTSYDLPVEQIITTQIHTHHVSYVPEETIEVCNSCHARIHNDDDFRPDLQPELSRSEWESQRGEGKEA